VEFRQRRARRVHQRKSWTQRKTPRIVEHPEGETVQRRAQRGKTECLRFCRALPGGHRASARSAQEELCFEFREDRTTAGSVELCQEGIG
jgi:hypothetical protein